ncbi:MAG: hypothetical protein NTX03_11435 [Bacteroidetes bacterium]|nr:hypothetical protein [Bacteroidota bacterium]
MRILIVISFLTLNFYVAFGQEMNQENQKLITDFIECIKYKKKSTIKVAFPLHMHYPVPYIKNRQEFIDRFDELFDDSLINIIVNSNPSKDWTEMPNNDWDGDGRGFRFLIGQIWLGCDGELTGVNYDTEVQWKKRLKLLQLDKDSLHFSIKEFEVPIYILETTHYRIRIDFVNHENIRYVSWPIGSKMSDEPDLILDRGRYITEGTGANHSFKFRHFGYVYKCYIRVVDTDDSPPALLTISRGDEIILSEKARIIGR